MEDAGTILKKILKAALVLIGGALIVGGGICTSTNIVFTVIDPSMYRFTGILLLICAVAILAGWYILKALGALGPGKKRTGSGSE